MNLIITTAAATTCVLSTAIASSPLFSEDQRKVIHKVAMVIITSMLVVATIALSIGFMVSGSAFIFFGAFSGTPMNPYEITLFVLISQIFTISAGYGTYQCGKYTYSLN